MECFHSLCYTFNQTPITNGDKMLPKRVVHGLLETSLGTGEQGEPGHPSLLITLPSSIRHHVVSMPGGAQFHCPQRQKLQEQCTNITEFDKRIVPPVGKTMDEMKTPLTQESYKAIKKEMQHSQPIATPLHTRVNEYKQQVVNQSETATSFYKAIEREGVTLPTVLAKEFDIKASLAAHNANTMQSMMKSPD